MKIIMLPFVYVYLTTSTTEVVFLPRFSRHSKADASKFIESFEEMFFQYYIHDNVYNSRLCNLSFERLFFLILFFLKKYELKCNYEEIIPLYHGKTLFIMSTVLLHFRRY